MLFKRAKGQLNDNESIPSLAIDALSVVARDAQFTGEFSTSGDVRVEGIVQGAVRARRCEVNAEGSVEGPIVAEEIIVRGRVRGTLRGYFIHLEDGAQVEGDIVNERIMIDSGAELTGSVWRSSDPLSEGENTAAQPAFPAHENPGFFQNSLWPETDNRAYRPLTAVRPR